MSVLMCLAFTNVNARQLTAAGAADDAGSLFKLSGGDGESLAVDTDDFNGLTLKRESKNKFLELFDLKRGHSNRSRSRSKLLRAYRYTGRLIWLGCGRLRSFINQKCGRHVLTHLDCCCCTWLLNSE